MTKTSVQLDVWQKAHQVVLNVYGLTREFPVEERYGLSTQMRKAAASIPANIAEGDGRRSPRDKAHFYTVATGSEYFLILARDLKYSREMESFYGAAEVVCRMLRRLTDATLRPVSRTSLQGDCRRPEGSSGP